MAVTQTLSEGLKREFEVIITKKEIEKLINQKLESIAKEANLPGFRPGKVPVSVVKNRFGKQIVGEVVRESVDSASKETMEKNKLTPSSQPKIEIVSFEEGKDLKAKLSIEIMPDFEVPDLSILDITKPVVKVSEKDINEAVEKIAKENIGTKVIAKNRPAKKGDTLVIDFTGKIDDQPFEGGEAKGHNLKLGSNTFIPGFEPIFEINSGILFFLEDSCLIVSSYKITPPIHSFIHEAVKRVSLNSNLFSGVDGTFTLSNLLVIVPLLSSAAKIPFPFSRILSAILFNSDILL